MGQKLQVKDTISDVLTSVKDIQVFEKEDFSFLIKNKNHLGLVLKNTHMWRTDLQKESIISDGYHPNSHSKFTQAILEQKEQTLCGKIINRAGKIYRGYITTLILGEVVKNILQKESDNTRKSADLGKLINHLANFDILVAEERIKETFNKIEIEKSIRAKLQDKINLSIAIYEDIEYIITTDKDVYDDSQSIKKMCRILHKKPVKIEYIYIPKSWRILKKLWKE